MKPLLCATLFISLCPRILSGADPAPLPDFMQPSEWSLVWQDDFEGTELDRTKWQHCPEWERCDGFTKWSDQDAFLDGRGHLLVQIARRDGRIRAGAIRTLGLFEQKFGYFEIRCEVPVISGGWCAFWMMPAVENQVDGSGRDGAEIDIFESIGAAEGKVNHALHWDGYGEHTKSEVHNLTDRRSLYDGFHTFGVLWTPDEYVFTIDGKESWRTKAGGVMQVPAYLKITLEAAAWAGDIEKESLPKQLKVDWVRVFQQAPDSR